jgi:hypothetical protein
MIPEKSSGWKTRHGLFRVLHFAVMPLAVLSMLTCCTKNSRPVAHAGSDQAVFVGQTVQLDGSASSDADKDPLSYQWSLTAIPTGSTAFLSSASAVNPSFVADRAGTYVAQLIVNDGTVDSAPDTVTIAVTNRKPIAEAGPNQEIFCR